MVAPKRPIVAISRTLRLRPRRRRPRVARASVRQPKRDRHRRLAVPDEHGRGCGGNSSPRSDANAGTDLRETTEVDVVGFSFEVCWRDTPRSRRKIGPGSNLPVRRMHWTGELQAAPSPPVLHLHPSREPAADLPTIDDREVAVRNGSAFLAELNRRAPSRGPAYYETQCYAVSMTGSWASSAPAFRGAYPGGSATCRASADTPTPSKIPGSWPTSRRSRRDPHHRTAIRAREMTLRSDDLQASGNDAEGASDPSVAAGTGLDASNPNRGSVTKRAGSRRPDADASSRPAASVVVLAGWRALSLLPAT